jgi:single-strand DNA-binding protein
VWREFAENVAGSLHKGSRVIVQGVLKQRSYETKEGEKRTSIELEVDAIGPDLRYATAAVQRVTRTGSPAVTHVDQDDDAQPASPIYSDEVPF